MTGLIIVAAVLIGGAQPEGGGASEAQPQLTDEQRARQQEARDRVQYRSLIRELRELERDHARTLADAMDEARASEDGQASLAEQADLLALRDRRDRLMNRLTLLSLRYGWEIPDLDAEEVAGSRGEVEGKEEIFAASASALRTRFAAEASEAAGLIDLPVIPLIVER